MAVAADALVADVRNAVLAAKLRENQRTPDQLRNRASEGFHMCAQTSTRLIADMEESSRSLSTAEQALMRSSHLFHEIQMAIDVDADVSRGGAERPRHRRSPDQLKSITADGFEVCVRALAAMGASDVTIHECGEQSFEEHW